LERNDTLWIIGPDFSAIQLEVLALKFKLSNSSFQIQTQILKFKLSNSNFISFHVVEGFSVLQNQNLSSLWPGTL